MSHAQLLKRYISWAEIDNQFQHKVNFSQTPVAEVSQSLGKIETSQTRLVNDIALFYGYNDSLNTLQAHGSGFLSTEHVHVFHDYNTFLNDFSQRVFAYILYCSLAEARHSKLITKNPHIFNEYDREQLYIDNFVKRYKGDKENYFYKEYLKKHPTGADRQAESFQEYMDDLGCAIIQKRFPEFIREQDVLLTNKAVDYILKKFKTQSSEDKVRAFLEGMIKISQTNLDGDGGELQYHMFNKQILELEAFNQLSIGEVLGLTAEFFLNHFEQGYGGKPWSSIAQHALYFTQGEMNAEMFLDKSLSLEHNGGNMFNKDFLYSDSDEWYDFPALYKSGYDYLNLSDKEVLFNLQNSGSVLITQHLPVLKKIEKMDFDVLKNLITSILPLSKVRPHGVGQLNYWHITTAFQENARLLCDVYRDLSVLPTLKKLEHLKNNINLAGFYLSKSKTMAKPRLQEHTTLYEPVWQAFNDLLFHPALVYGKKSKSASAFKAFNYFNLNDKNNQQLNATQIGGKAKGLLDLTHLGYRVPKAMVFDTQTCLSYLNNKTYFSNQFKKISTAMERYLQDAQGNPILVSVRSGAPVSMPGMMDTVLNVGIDDKTYPLLVQKYGQAMVDECAISFMTQFCASKFNQDEVFALDEKQGLKKALNKFVKILIHHKVIEYRESVFPLGAVKQVELCIHSVFDSWHSPRAISWRQENNISHELGTAATIQQMVFGNLNDKSLTCVVFSRDCVSGKKQLLGEYLPHAQGEDLVSGKRTPQNIAQLHREHPQLYREIAQVAKQLEVHHQAIQDIEITVENGIVYVLQKRNAVVSAQAHMLLAKEFGTSVSEKLSAHNVLNVYRVQTQDKPDNIGLSASPGVIQGIVVRTEADVKRYRNQGNLIFLADQALPEHAPIMIATQAFITQSGGATSHAAILARSMQKPCVVGAGKMNFETGSTVCVDATEGKIWNSEQEIVEQKKQADALAKLVLKEKGISLEKYAQFHQLSLSLWAANFAHAHVEKIACHKFLSIAQQTAAILLHEQKRKLKI